MAERTKLQAQAELERRRRARLARRPTVEVLVSDYADLLQKVEELTKQRGRVPVVVLSGMLVCADGSVWVPEPYDDGEKWVTEWKEWAPVPGSQRALELATGKAASRPIDMDDEPSPETHLDRVTRWSGTEPPEGAGR